MTTTLSFLSLNVRGVGTDITSIRARDFVSFSSPSLVCLQETNLSLSSSRSFVWSQWPYTFYHSFSASPRGSGVSTGLLPSLASRVIFHASFLGYCLYLRLSIPPTNPTSLPTFMHVFNIYIPPDDPTALKVLDFIQLHLASAKVDDSIYLLGDFNCTLDPSLDRRNCVERRRIIASGLRTLTTTNALTDGYRLLRPTSRSYTWRSRNSGTLLSARLDRFYYNCPLHLKSVQHLPSLFSDHDAVLVRFFPRIPIPRGPPFWRLDPLLLQDQAFVDTARVEISDLLTNRNPDASLPFWWFNVFKPAIRSFCVLFWHSRHVTHALETTRLQAQLERSQPHSAAWYQCTDALRQIQTRTASDNLTRARSIHHATVDSPTKAFFRLGQTTPSHEVMPAVYDASGIMVTDPEPMRDVVCGFYEDLYSAHAQHGDPTIFATLSQHLLTISCDSAEALSDELSLPELSAATKSLPRGKACGLDGLPVEFYLAFWDILGPVLLQVLVALPTTPGFWAPFTESVVSLLPKVGDLVNLANWRPISVTNSDYKLFAKLLANRLKPVAQSIIDPSQTCSVPGRTIYDTLVILRDLIALANRHDEPLAIVNIDFAKAFDRVDHTYLFQVLDRFGLPASFVSTLRCLYTSAHFRLRFNNSLTRKIAFNRGIRQGCPLSSVLFVIALEPLQAHLRASVALRQGPSYYRQVTGSYADDLNAFLRSFSDFDALDTSLKLYSAASGAVVNADKSFTLWCGSWSDRTDKPLAYPSRNDGGKFLGIYLGNTDAWQDKNWPDLLSRITKVFGRWKRLHHLCSISGRALVVNQIASTVLWHRLKILDPPAAFVTEAQRLLNNFLWDGVHWVAAPKLHSPLHQGGLALVNISQKLRSFRLAAATHLGTTPPFENTAYDTAIALCHATGSPFTNPSDLFLADHNIRAPFYNTLFRFWHDAPIRLSFSDSTYRTLASVPVFGSRFVREVTGLPIPVIPASAFFRANLVTIGDFVSPEGLFLSPDELFPLARAARSTIDIRDRVVSALVRSFPGVFTINGISPGYVFGAANALTFNLECRGAQCVSRIPLTSTTTVRAVYHGLISMIFPGSNLQLPDTLLPPNGSSHTWDVRRLSPFTTRAENSIQWRAWHGSLPAPRRLFHIVPDFPSPHCPFCPVVGDFFHVYLNCPFTRLCLNIVMSFIFVTCGHNHAQADYWFLVPGVDHYFCNLCFIITKHVLYELYKDFAVISLSEKTITDYVHKFSIRFRARVYGRYRSCRRFADLGNTLPSFDALWRIKEL